MRRSDRHYPPSPPRHYVTPSESRHDYENRQRPVVYQVYGNMPESSSGFPGGFSPVRTSSHRPPHNSISPPPVSRSSAESLYASFSPPRRSPQLSRHNRPGGGNSSIFRPRQMSVIVARENSNEYNSPATHSYTMPSVKALPCQSKKAASVTRSSVSSFPSKLHMILSNPDFQEYICWLPVSRFLHSGQRYLLQV